VCGAVRRDGEEAYGQLSYVPFLIYPTRLRPFLPVEGVEVSCPTAAAVVVVTIGISERRGKCAVG
jgi:hypothetical protein